MFEELDHLEVKIRSLVERYQALSQECVALRREVESLRSERQSLRAAVSESQAELLDLRSVAGQAESVVVEQKRQSQEQVDKLQGKLDLFAVQKSGLEADLIARQKEVVRLRDMARDAQMRIEGVLERLPGALAQGKE